MCLNFYTAGEGTRDIHRKIILVIKVHRTYTVKSMYGKITFGVDRMTFTRLATVAVSLAWTNWFSWLYLRKPSSLHADYNSRNPCLSLRNAVHNIKTRRPFRRSRWHTAYHWNVFTPESVRGGQWINGREFHELQTLFQNLTTTLG